MIARPRPRDLVEGLGWMFSDRPQHSNSRPPVMLVPHHFALDLDHAFCGRMDFTGHVPAPPPPHPQDDRYCWRCTATWERHVLAIWRSPAWAEERAAKIARYLDHKGLDILPGG